MTFWVMVPTEATRGMINALAQSAECGTTEEAELELYITLLRDYAAMLSARPSFTVSEETVEAGALAMARKSGRSDAEIAKIKAQPLHSSAMHWWHYQEASRACIEAFLKSLEK